MLKYYGITELTGRPGSGKTAISMDEASRCESIYITTTTFCVRRYDMLSTDEMEHILIRYVSSIEELVSFVMNGLEAVVRVRNVKLIVVDSLDHLMETEEKSVRLNNMIFRMVNKLRRINRKYSTNILIVTCYYGGWTIESFCVSNPILGLSWMYMVNTRYVCDERRLRLVCSPMNDEYECVFRVEPYSVVYHGAS